MENHKTAGPPEQQVNVHRLNLNGASLNGQLLEPLMENQTSGGTIFIYISMHIMHIFPYIYISPSEKVFGDTVMEGPITF